MAGEVGIDHAQGFFTFANDVNALRDNLNRMHRPHTLLPAGPAEFAVESDELRHADSTARGKISSFTTVADRGLSGLAFVSGWIGVNYPGTDQASGKRLAGLVDRASAEIPPLRPELPTVDPRFMPAAAEE